MPSTGLAAPELSLNALRDVPAERRCDVALGIIRRATGEARQTALRVSAELVPETDMAALLHDEGDDVARNAGLEMLKLRGRRALPLAVSLLSESDEDVVMQAIQLIDAIGDPRGWEAIRPLLQHDNPNIVQSVIAAAPRVGGRSAALDLLPFLQRDTWLQIAAIDSIGRLRTRLALPELRRLLLEPLTCDFAADALARIGGIMAARCLIGHFVNHETELDAEHWLGLIASVLADLEAPYADRKFRERVASYLQSEHAALAAACLLALGQGPHDVEALAALAGGSPPNHLPLCLRRRGDLVPLLLTAQPPVCHWGLELARIHVEAIDGTVMARALLFLRPEDPELLATLVGRVTDPLSLIALFVASPVEVRPALIPTLRSASSTIAPLIDSEVEDAADRILLQEITGTDARAISASIAALDIDARVRVLGQLQTAAVADELPWQAWLESAPATFLPIFAETAARFRSESLRARFRDLLRERPSAALIKCAGAVGDPATVPLLTAAYGSATPLERAFALEALGEIGTPQAQHFLREVTFGSTGADARLAGRAFARCADDGNRVELTALTGHEEWAVRLAAVEALGRIAGADASLLQTLMADPSPLVAEKAFALFEATRGEE